MKKIRCINGMKLFLGLTIVFQLIYYTWIRGMISDVGVFHDIHGNPGGATPRDIADRFVCCVGLLHYLLLGYLYAVKRHYEERSLRGKDGNIRLWLELEILFQLGMFAGYYLVWIDTYILRPFVSGRILSVIGCDVGYSKMIIYRVLEARGMIPKVYVGRSWTSQEWDFFVFSIIIAPIALMFLIYSTHLVYRTIQFKRIGCLNIIWVRWNLLLLVAILLVALRWLQLEKFF